MAALAHAVPLVVVPLGADQPANAERVAALGLGRVVGPEERTAAAIGAAARAVLGDPGYRERARRARAEAEALPGLAQAVGLLERLAAERRPLLRSPAPR
jgi:UDP:flavonoid glycosyltransferase YjiC (YdhE family)